MSAEGPRRTIPYCEVCSLPFEYCEFGPSTELCKKKTREQHPDLFQKLYGSLAEGGEEDAAAVAADEAKIKGKGSKGNKKAKDLHVYIKRSERNKRKCVTTVCNLQAYDIDLKKAAKMFANKFACGSSVVKNPQGADEIVVQGDVSDEVEELILSTWTNVLENLIEFVEEKKSKK